MSDRGVGAVAGQQLVAVSSYIMAATPRSGSTLLCDLLSGTGIAGQPQSYYRREDVLVYAQEWGVS